MAIKAREIRERLKGKCDEGIIFCLCALAEDNSVLRQQLVEVAQSIDKMAEINDMMIQVAGNMKSTIETLRKKDSNVDVGSVSV